MEVLKALLGKKALLVLEDKEPYEVLVHALFPNKIMMGCVVGGPNAGFNVFFTLNDLLVF